MEKRTFLRILIHANISTLDLRTLLLDSKVCVAGKSMSLAYSIPAQGQSLGVLKENSAAPAECTKAISPVIENIFNHLKEVGFGSWRLFHH